ncbi:MAG TPA: hypothetical protein PKN48_00655 [Bacteroidales bacterium]|nr:hypothetical protein [Bacteroidales bacterium]
MAHLPNLSRRNNVVEHITITTTDATAKSGNFGAALGACSSLDVVIQNLSGVACYITFGVTGATATTGSLYLAANGSVSLSNVTFLYYSVLRASTDVTVVVTGIGG